AYRGRSPLFEVADHVAYRGRSPLFEVADHVAYRGTVEPQGRDQEFVPPKALHTQESPSAASSRTEFLTANHARRQIIQGVAGFGIA
ncbi:MAG: hypothetical protein ACK56I_15875, partial [bacterium]